MQPVLGLEQLTAMVVDEIALHPYPGACTGVRFAPRLLNGWIDGWLQGAFPGVLVLA